MKSNLFLIIMYIVVILGGVLTLVVDFVHNEVLSWVIITLGVVNLVYTLFKRKK